MLAEILLFLYFLIGLILSLIYLSKTKDSYLVAFFIILIWPLYFFLPAKKEEECDC